MSDGPQQWLLRERDVARRFDRAAGTFDDCDFVHRHCFKGLLDRAEPLRLDRPLVLDLGCATGRGSRELAKHFRRARIVSLDASRPMLERARSTRSRFSRIREVQADARRLPFRTASFDVVWANLLLPWQSDPAPVFQEARRVLRPEGVFLFSSLGPDSFRELRAAWQEDDNPFHVHPLWDMHDLGDGLMRAGLSDPVLDVDPLRVRYRSASALFRDLTGAGARNALCGRRRSLTGKGRFARMTRALEAAESSEFELSLELVYGHAFAPQARAEGAEIRISPGSIGRRR